LTKLAGPGASPIACTVMIVQAVFVAPFTEEFIFRGVMLPWLSRSWWGGWVAMVGAVVFTMLYAPGQWQPLAFALLICLLGFAYTFPQAGEQWVRRSIIGTALLFAMVHVNVWPSPMPLFVLGLALGWAAHRTRGLIAPIVLHSLFNAVSAIVLLFGLFD
jgi:membrane protease YdiL (CAAX protease family)